MGIRVGLSACAVGLVLWLIPWGVRGAAAEPSDACRELSARFAGTPEQLDLQALARLGACLITEIGERLGAMEPSAGAREETPSLLTPQGETASPSPTREGTSPPLARRRGEWPPPAPWTESWPPPSPWEP
jgi:hypothetical protein